MSNVISFPTSRRGEEHADFLAFQELSALMGARF
jgi:hypothetical protein